MLNFNKVIVTGHLGQKPEMRKAGPNTKVSRFSLAVKDRWTDGQGHAQERVNWLPIVCWNGLAENVTRYMEKGAHVLVEGSLRVNQWEDEKTKEKKSRTEIIASNVYFLEPKDGEEAVPEQPAA